MVQFLSPDVIITETDDTGTVQGVSTAAAGIAGLFRWGPIGKLSLVSSEADLKNQYAGPTNYNAETWFSAANFLGYSQSLLVSRAANTSANLVANAFPQTALSFINDNNMIVTASSNTLTTNTSNVNFSFSNSQVFSANVGEFVLIQQLNKANTANVVATNFRQITGANSSVVQLDQPLTFTNSNTSVNIVTVTKLAGTTSAFANVGTVDTPSAQMVPNADAFATAQTSFNSNVLYVAKFPGNLGNSLRVATCASPSQYSSNITVTNAQFTVGSTTAVLNFADVTAANAAWQSSLSNGDFLVAGNNSIGTQTIQIANVGAQPSGNTITLTLAQKFNQSANFSGVTSVQRFWEFYKQVGIAPQQTDFVAASGNTAANDGVHVIVADQDGLFTGTPGAILEVFQNLSRATNAMASQGNSNYFKNVINGSSRYVWVANDRSGEASATALLVASASSTNPLSVSFVAGGDGAGESTVDFGSLAAGWSLFTNKDLVDVDLLITGKAVGGSYGEQLPNFIYDNVASIRKDCVVFASPSLAAVVNNVGNEQSAVVNFGNALEFNTYIIMDTGYKYQYDRYNDVYRWIPLNADVAGLCALGDYAGYPWDSPGNGAIKNCIKLAWSPCKAARDVIYPQGINPVVTFPGQGTVLYGDRTHTTKPTAFNRINTRRAFLFFEKTVDAPARAVLFKNNTPATRNRFKQSITPFFNNVKALGGIEDFQIVCDETVNTPEVISQDQFVGKIRIKPVYSINWVVVGFVAEQPGTSFTETVV